MHVRIPNGCGYHIRSTHFCKNTPTSTGACTFCHFISGDYCITISYILINFVRENRSKPALYNSVNLVLIELSEAKQQCNKLEWLFNNSFMVSYSHCLTKVLNDLAQLVRIYTRESI